MAKSRTNSLHQKLPVELRRQVERDVIEQPPGRATYEEVYEYYQLASRGISFTAFARYAGYLRMLARNAAIKELADQVTGHNLGTMPADMIRARLFEALTSEECKIGDLLKLAMTDNLVSKTRIAETELAARQRQLADAIAAAERTETDDPAKALANLKDNVRMIYGIGGEQ